MNVLGNNITVGVGCAQADARVAAFKAEKRLIVHRLSVDHLRQGGNGKMGLARGGVVVEEIPARIENKRGQIHQACFIMKRKVLHPQLGFCMVDGYHRRAARLKYYITAKSMNCPVIYFLYRSSSL